ncbi:DMT family transporter [Roseomonas sp. CCTCC AB2023176]|uniref:DMT family transporter n=1 Tax=Roseomonas sp. CCTCC AB2023176 TaxID=3342640 RepID=UPI0035DAEE4D
MPTTPNWLRGGAMLAGAAITWGAMFAVVKPLMAEIDPFTLTVLRYGPAAPIFLGLLVAVEGRAALATEGKAFRLWWLGTLGFAGFGLLAFLGLRSTRPEHASVIPAMMPLIAVAIAALRQRAWPAPRAIAAVLLGLLGVALVVTHGDPRALLTGGAGGGEALIFLGASAWVLYTLGAAAFPGWSGLRYTALTAAFGALSIGAIELLALALGAAHLPAAATLAAAAPSLLYLVLLAAVAAVIGWNAGMRALGPARGVLFINLVPVTAFLIAVVGGRVPAAAEIAGVALVIAALLLNSLTAAPRPPVPVRAVGARG